MKFLKYAIVIPILIGCNSNNNSIEILKKNAKSYEEISNTIAYRSKDAIVYFTLYDNYLKINLIDKSDDKELEINSCNINSKDVLLERVDNGNLGLTYKAEVMKNIKKFKIKCILNNGENIDKTIVRYD